jgi:hypothetical protein
MVMGLPCYLLLAVPGSVSERLSIETGWRSTMQNTKSERDRILFDQYVAEMQDFLTRHFGIRAGVDGISMARDYHAKGRSPQFCAYAVARMNNLIKSP